MHFSHFVLLLDEGRPIIPVLQMMKLSCSKYLIEEQLVKDGAAVPTLTFGFRSFYL